MMRGKMTLLRNLVQVWVILAGRQLPFSENQSEGFLEVTLSFLIYTDKQNVTLRNERKRYI
jgi:hypothetical protein